MIEHDTFCFLLRPACLAASSGWSFFFAENSLSARIPLKPFYPKNLQEKIIIIKFAAEITEHTIALTKMSRLITILLLAALCLTVKAQEYPEAYYTKEACTAENRLLADNTTRTAADDTLTTAEDTLSEATSSPQPAVATPPQFVPHDTYKTWLGERCLDLSGQKKMYYGWNRDVSYTGLPLIASAFLIKSQKKAFRSARFAMDEKWKTEIDNYTQYSPYALLFGLKAFGYQGRSSWDRMIVSALLSNAVMAALTNTAKYSIKEMRPDNSSRNSFPSGHTATVFTAATILHKEYGMTRSPWYSIGGYAVAIGTGFMRVLNNRHWISDVMAGAGIGILSTEMGYFLADLIYRNKGICRLEKPFDTISDHPSFFDIQMGVGMHTRNLKATDDRGILRQFNLGTSTMVGIETAHFFNRHIGVGAMARITTTPTTGIELKNEEKDMLVRMNQKLEAYDMPRINDVSMADNHFIDASLDLGAYGNLPLSRHFALGAKVLGGVRAYSGFESKATAGYPDKEDGNERFQSGEYALSKLSGGLSFNYVLGLSATYRFRGIYSWKVFFDFDSSRNRYSYTMNLFNDETMHYMQQRIDSMDKLQEQQEASQQIQKIKEEGQRGMNFTSRFNLFTIGGAFCVSF